MENGVYTHASWRIRSGRQEDFVAAWEELGQIFSELPDPPIGPGTLIRSVSDPLQFYSFGAWRSADAVVAMRRNPRAQRAIDAARSLCTAATPGVYEVVSRVASPQPPARAREERPRPHHHG